MLQLNLRRAMVHLEHKQLLNEPSPEKEKVQAYVPRASSELRLHTALQLDAQYLNMNINELEPLIEPWQMSGHAVKPLGRGDETGRILSGRLYSSRLLQLNLSSPSSPLNHLSMEQLGSLTRHGASLLVHRTRPLSYLLTFLPLDRAGACSGPDGPRQRAAQ